MVVGLDIVNNVLVVFHCFITEKTIQLNLLQISFFIKELCYGGITEVFGNMGIVGLVIAPIVAITIVAVSVVIVMTVVIVCAMVTAMSSTCCELIFVLVVIMSLFDVMWSVVLWNLMTD